jgi:fumarate hydratase subunit alpha
MINQELIRDVTLDLLRKASYSVPPDVKAALQSAQVEEKDGMAQEHLAMMLKNIEVAERLKIPTCADTGMPLFYVKIGTECKIPSGAWTIEEGIKDGVRLAVNEVPMRPSAVHPFTRFNPNTNVGPYMPYIAWKYQRDFSGLEITANPKGNGTERIAAYSTVVFGENYQGFKKFVLDSLVAAGRRKYCWPVIVGIGVGGVSNIAMQLARECSTLRRIGERHPESLIHGLEVELLEKINLLGIGPMANFGETSALDVFIEYAYTGHGGKDVYVAINYECPMARRSTARITEDGGVIPLDHPRWLR